MRRRAALLLTFAAAVGCGGDPPTSPNTVDTVEVAPAGVTIVTGDTVRLRAIARNSAGDTVFGRAVVWSSSDTNVARVSVLGLVTARAKGTATITATIDARNGTAVTTIVAHIAELLVNPNSDTLFTGDSTAWFTTTLDSAGQPVFGRTVTWEVADTTIVRPRPIGNDVWLRGRAPGVTWVIAMSEGLRDSARMTVRNAVGSVSIAPDGDTILIASTLLLSATLRDTAGTVVTGRRIVWDVLLGPATIDSTGLLRADAGGIATIRARSETRADTARYFFRVDGSFTTVTAGDLHTCGITTAGKTYCWGSGAFGQLGIGGGAQGNILGPALVIGGATYDELSAGYLHQCARTSAMAQCWGLDTFGALGNSSGVMSCTYGDSCRGSPLAVSGSISFAQVAAGDRLSCGLDGSGAAYCWGVNSLGGLGIGTTDPNPHTSPQAVTGGFSFEHLAVGGGHVCALSSGRAYCWGYDAYGQLGAPDTARATNAAPDTVDGGHRFVSLSAGRYHTCGVRTDSAAYCWGLNEAGVLGTGVTGPPVLSPVAVQTSLKFVALAAGLDHTCGIATDSLAYCWGKNDSGQLGDGATAPHYTPMPVSGGLKFAVIAANRGFTCGVTTSNVAYCWGGDGSGGGGEGRLGTDPGTPTTAPGRVRGQP